jgi:hypothetical protein
MCKILYMHTKSQWFLSHKQCISILVPSKLLHIYVCYTYIHTVCQGIVFVMEQRIKKYHFTLQHYVGAFSIAFTENSVYWTHNICGLNHQYPITTLSFISFHNNVLNSVHSVSPFMTVVTIF